MGGASSAGGTAAVQVMRRAELRPAFQPFDRPGEAPSHDAPFKRRDGGHRHLRGVQTFNNLIIIYFFIILLTNDVI